MDREITRKTKQVIKKLKEFLPSYRKGISLSASMTGMIVMIVFVAAIVVMIAFTSIYRRTMEQNAITSSEQAVVQVQNMITNYTVDMDEIMDMIGDNISKDVQSQNDYFEKLMEIRSDVVAVTAYDEYGNLKSCWAGGDSKLKEKIVRNLSYIKVDGAEEVLDISSPHVESLFYNYYPWVVTIARKMLDNNGLPVQISMDIRFSNIANYVDDVGIGQHGYCFIMDTDGNIVYHPQQQLIYSGLKDENMAMLETQKDGSYTISNVIYTIHTLENCNWRIVGVSYMDEMITSRVENMVKILAALLTLVVITAIISGLVFSRLISKPANRLARAMEAFEADARKFEYQSVKGSSEIMKISDSFGHMVLQIQELMEQVRQEEVSLRKTELNALQAQINPHFLYNTLDSIAWMCEEERTEEAVTMVNALARLFRISISKGHEMITLEKELQHAESYLKIQKYRYKNHFNYEFKVEESCLGYFCNKITLQPIIENAIYHGLDLMDEGKILIEIKEQGDDILLSVEDNGVGMTKEQCSEILLHEAGDKTGIGIKNVNDRIKIYFGDKYGLTIISELDEGTKVNIRIPKCVEGEANVK